MVSIQHIPDYMGHSQQTLSSLQMILPLFLHSKTVMYDTYVNYNLSKINNCVLQWSVTFNPDPSK